MRWLALFFGVLVGGVAQAQPVLPFTQTSVPISVATGTTQLVAASSGLRIYPAVVLLIGTATVTFVYGTGVNCATGQQTSTGAMVLTGGFSLGNGGGALWVVPPGNALCITTTAAMTGVLAYAQF